MDDRAELDEFDDEPWSSKQVSGQIVFSALQQTAGRRAVLRDRDALPLFYDAVRAIERELDSKTAERLSDTVRRVFDRVLKELADVANPMHALVDEGEPASNESFPPPVGDPVEEMGAPRHRRCMARAEPQPARADGASEVPALEDGWGRR